MLLNRGAITLAACQAISKFLPIQSLLLAKIICRSPHLNPCIARNNTDPSVDTIPPNSTRLLYLRKPHVDTILPEPTRLLYLWKPRAPPPFRELIMVNLRRLAYPCRSKSATAITPTLTPSTLSKKTWMQSIPIPGIIKISPKRFVPYTGVSAVLSGLKNDTFLFPETALLMGAAAIPPVPSYQVRTESHQVSWKSPPNSKAASCTECHKWVG